MAVTRASMLGLVDEHGSDPGRTSCDTSEQSQERAYPTTGVDHAWRTSPPLDRRAEADDRGAELGTWRLADGGGAPARHQYWPALHLAPCIDGSAACRSGTGGWAFAQ